MGLDNLSTNLSIDTSSFTGPLMQAADVAVTTGAKITAAINEQMNYWRNLTAVAVASATGTVAAIAGIKAASMAASAAMSAGKFAADHVKESVLIGAAGAAILKYGSIVNTVAKITIPQYAAIGTAVGLAFGAYNLANSDMAKNAVEMVTSNGAVQKSFEKLKSATTGLTDALASPFSNASAVAGHAVQSLIEQWSPVPAIMQAVGSATASSLDLATAAITGLQSVAQQANDSMTAGLLSLANGDIIGAQTQKFYEEAASLRQLEADSKKLIATQEAQREQFKTLGQIQEAAIRSAQAAEEIRSVSDAKTLEDINEINQRYQTLFTERMKQAAAGQALADGEKKFMEQIFATIAAQKIAIDTGRIKPTEDSVDGGEFGGGDAVRSMIESAKQQLNILKMGEDEAALAAATAKGATESELSALRQVLEQKREAKKVDEQRKAFEQAAAKAADEEKRLAEQATQKIASLTAEYDKLTGSATKAQIAEQEALRSGMAADAAKEIGDLTQKIDDAVNSKKASDQIKKLQDDLDVMTGKATKGEIAMRDALGNGATDEQAQEIKRLTDEAEAERQRQQQDKKTDTSQSKAAMVGSAESAKIFLRGLGGNKDDTKKEIEKSNKYLEKLVENTKPNSFNVPTMLGSNLLGSGA